MEKFKSFLVASNLAANTVSAYITAIKNYNEKEKVLDILYKVWYQKKKRGYHIFIRRII